MKPEVLDLHRRMLSAYQEIYDLLATVAQDTKENERRKTELADTAFAMREIATLADQVRKRAAAIQDIAENIACALAIRDQDDEPIRTEFVVASPHIKQAARVPNARDPERYRLFMSHLGVPEELWNRVTTNDDVEDKKEIVRLHWPGVLQYLSEAAERGEPVPPGMKSDLTYPVYSLRMRAKKRSL